MIIAVSVVVFSSWHILYGFLAALILLTATAEALLPTRFTVSESGVEAVNLFRSVKRPWVRFESWREGPSGYYLRGQGPIGFLARRRSIWLPCPGEDDAVRRLLEQHLGEPG